jgi:hypothetical protein
MKLSEAEYRELVDLIAKKLKKMGFATDSYEEEFDDKSTMLIKPVEAITKIVDGETDGDPIIRISVSAPVSDNPRPVAAVVLRALIRAHAKDQIDASPAAVTGLDFSFLTLRNLGASRQERKASLKRIMADCKLHLADTAITAVEALRGKLERHDYYPRSITRERAIRLTNLAFDIRDHRDDPAAIIKLCGAADGCRNKINSPYSGPAMFKEIGTQTEVSEVVEGAGVVAARETAKPK